MYSVHIQCTTKGSTVITTRPLRHSSNAHLDTRTLARWAPTFLGFPLAGLAARAVAGSIDDLASALAGGLAAGVVLGAVQALALGHHLAGRGRWVLATGVGMAVGLGLGAAAVGYDTDASSLVVMGALTGAGVGVAQAAVLRASARRRAAWAVATPCLWALGWWITSMVIVDADRQHANFGASGALVVTLLGGLLLAAGGRDAATGD